jgi:hypothetical protein
MTSASKLSHISNSLSSVTRGKLVRCLNLVARTSRAHNRCKGSGRKTNAICYRSVCVTGQQEQHHVPRDLEVI